MKLTFSIILLGIACVATAQEASQKPRLVNVTSGVDSYRLTKNQIAQLTNDALAGSGDAAVKLSAYYSNVALNFDQGRYWTIIAAENGSAVGQYNAWDQLRTENDVDSKRRALFWLKRAAAQGDRDAAAQLEKSEHEPKH